MLGSTKKLSKNPIEIKMQTKPTLIDCQPPYYVVTFANKKTATQQGYSETLMQILALAQKQKGFLGLDSCSNAENFGITNSYWESLADIKNWKQQSDHLIAQNKGKERWYECYTVNIAKVEHSYAFNSGE